jgi:hypothetical protein
VSELNVGLTTPASPSVAFQIDYTTQTDQQLSLYSVVKRAGALPCASSYELEEQQNQNENGLSGYGGGTSVFGGPTTTTAIDTETYGSYLICSWVEGPNNGEVDAAATTPIFVGTPPAPPAPQPASPGLRFSYVKVSRRHGATVHGTAAAGLSGRVAVGATCGNMTNTDRVIVSAGEFSARLRIPRSCRGRAQVKISASWHGSASFEPQHISETIRTAR